MTRRIMNIERENYLRETVPGKEILFYMEVENGEKSLENGSAYPVEI